MHSHEILREVFKDGSVKQIAADLGLSISMIYKWAEPPEEGAGSGASNPLDRVEALIRSTNDPRLVQWISQRAGGFFINNPKTTSSEAQIRPNCTLNHSASQNLGSLSVSR